MARKSQAYGRCFSDVVADRCDDTALDRGAIHDIHNGHHVSVMATTVNWNALVPRQRLGTSGGDEQEVSTIVRIRSSNTCSRADQNRISLPAGVKNRVNLKIDHIIRRRPTNAKGFPQNILEPIVQLFTLLLVLVCVGCQRSNPTGLKIDVDVAVSEVDRNEHILCFKAPVRSAKLNKE